MRLSNNKILVTGGGSGIGFGLTERFVQENNTVITCGRREDALNAVKEKLPSVITRVCDLSREDERAGLYSWIAADHPDLNVLLNNAGIQQWVSVTDDDFYARSREEIETNVLAPVHLVSLLVKLKSLQTIINVTSGLAFVPFQKFRFTAAPKHLCGRSPYRSGTS